MGQQSTNRELLLRKASDAIEGFPSLYCRIMSYRLGAQSFSRVVHPDTDITIEGFPRCANSFAVQAFRSANELGSKLRIATHLHSPANILQSIQYRVPTLVLIRDPDEALVSWLALAVQLKKLPIASLTQENQLRRMQYWTRRYAQFYEKLMGFRGAFVCADFDEVVSDYGSCIDRLNHRFETSFNRFEHSDASVSEIFGKSKVHLSPSADREHIKAEIREYYFSKENARNRARAQQTYTAFHRIK